MIFIWWHIRVHEKYPELPNVMQVALVLAHGQASVECGFIIIIWFLSWTKMMTVINDHIKVHQVQPQTLVIDQKMVRSFKSTWHKYNIHSENIRKNEKKDETQEQLTYLDNQLSGLRVQWESIEKTIFSLDQIFEVKVSKGDRLNQNLLITEGTALKVKSKEKAEELKILKRKIQKVEEEKAKKNKTINIVLLIINQYSFRFTSLRYKPYWTLWNLVKPICLLFCL